MRIAMRVSYDGTAFSGWQNQPHRRTVQGVLEEAAAKICGAPVGITGSGRTDAGVHAAGQVCHFDADVAIPAPRFRECFNRILPSDVRVLESAEAPPDFDCSRSAKRKTYRYAAYYAETELPLLERYAARLGFRPSVERMRRAAALCEGTHDFAAFRATGGSAKTTVRTIESVLVTERSVSDGTVYEVTVCGNGFLYNMVRILAGELFAIGCGKEETALIAALNGGGRALLGKTMPAKGLTMIGVKYQKSPFGDGRE